MKIIFVKK